MRDDILKILKRKFTGNAKIKPVDSEVVQSEGFLLSEHASAISKVCKEHHYSVSFRAAGDATLERIRKGNPCKGHDIMNKSIKFTGGSWTYDYSDVELLKDLSGLVGYSSLPDSDSDSDSKKKPTLSGLCQKKAKDDKEEIPFTRVPIPIDEKSSFSDKELLTIYTGDYDMHDLFAFRHGQYNRIIAGTVDEASAVDQLNLAMLEKSPDRLGKVKERERLWRSEYSLIRHGAQTSFMCYLHSITGIKDLKKAFLELEDKSKIPYEDTIMKISEPICMFNMEGKIFILKNREEIYSYYKNNDMLQQIPFYYFFNLLRDNKEKWNLYAQTINKYLMRLCGLDS